MLLLAAVFLSCFVATSRAEEVYLREALVFLSNVFSLRPYFTHLTRPIPLSTEILSQALIDGERLHDAKLQTLARHHNVSNIKDGIELFLKNLVLSQFHEEDAKKFVRTFSYAGELDHSKFVMEAKKRVLRFPKLLIAHLPTDFKEGKLGDINGEDVKERSQKYCQVCEHPLSDGTSLILFRRKDPSMVEREIKEGLRTLISPDNLDVFCLRLLLLIIVAAVIWMSYLAGQMAIHPRDEPFIPDAQI